MSSILSSILGGGAPAPAHGAQAGGSYSDGGSSDPASCIQRMLDAGKKYLQEEPDQEDLLTMHKILTQLQQLRAKDQQEADGALQGKVSPRLVRKAGAASGAGSTGGGY